MVAPALTAIAKEFHITNEVEIQLTLSIFVQLALFSLVRCQKFMAEYQCYSYPIYFI